MSLGRRKLWCSLPGSREWRLALPRITSVVLVLYITVRRISFLVLSRYHHVHYVLFHLSREFSHFSTRVTAAFSHTRLPLLSQCSKLLLYDMWRHETMAMTDDYHGDVLLNEGFFRLDVRSRGGCCLLMRIEKRR
jgi:hypothetical protein